MNKKKILVYVVTFLMIFNAYFGMLGCNITKASESLHNKKACWVSYEDIYNNLSDKTETEFRVRLNIMYDNIIKNNMNTVIMHVRPMGDAIYPSDYFPWSTYISSNRQAPEYNPLQIMVELAHKKGLKFEAWINPYRISLSNKLTESYSKTEFYEDYRSFIIEYKNSSGENCMILDPARQETIDLITNGVKEIVEKYDVDGIHFDDYFYVDGMDTALSTEEKMNNVNKLVSNVYTSIKEIDEECEFGISPAGNIGYSRSLGADVDRWMSEEGYVDYIMPQIYWSDSYITSQGETTMFTNRCNEWLEINKRDIPIYVGLALYRVSEESETDKGWLNQDDNLKKQYKTAYGLGYDGYALFRYAWLEKDISIKELTNLNQYINCMEGKNTLRSSYVSYTSYVDGLGWQSFKIDGIVSGTTKDQVAIKAISIRLGSNIEGDIGISYRTYVEDKGWQSWSKDGGINGPLDKDEGITALQIKLEGGLSREYDINYRVYVKDEGWMDWVRNGMATGAPKYDACITAIQIIVSTPKS